MGTVNSVQHPGWRPLWAFLLPLIGYLIYAAGLWEGHPNRTWMLLLFLWALAAGGIAWTLASQRANRLLDWTDRHAALLAVCSILLAAGGLMAFSIWQTRNFAAGAQAEDTAYYSQVLWNTLHGHFLSGNVQQARIYHPPVSSDFALHLSPFLLFVLLPIYAMSPSALTLLLVRDICLVAAAWPLFLFVRDRLGGSAGLSAVFLYLANPAVIAQGMEAFYLLHFAPLPFFFALRAYDREWFGAFCMWALIALGVREDVTITLIGFGLLMIFVRRRWNWLAAGFIPACVWWFFATLVIQPLFGHAGNSALDAGLAGGQPSPAGAYSVLLSGPGWILDALRKGALSFLYMLFRSVAFLACLGWEATLAVPVLAATVFLGHVYYQGSDPFSRFALLPSCALIGAAILIVCRLGLKYTGDRRVFSLVLLLLLPSICLLDGAKNAIRDRLDSYTVANDKNALREALRLIPSAASVAAPNYALPALSKRQTLYYIQYFYMYPPSPVDYFLFDQNIGRITSRPDLRQHYSELRDRLSQSSDYEKIWQKGDYYLLHRKAGIPVP